MNKLTLDAPVQGPPAPAGSPAAQDRAVQDRAIQDPAVQDQPQPAAPARPADKVRPPAPEADRAAAEDSAEGAPVQPPRLSAAVLAQIAGALRQGEAPLAAQADLVALHKRIAEMFTTLNEGLGTQAAQKASADRAALSARIDQLETAVNRMEGALRIEFEPVLKAAVAEAMAQAAPKPRRRWRAPLAALLLAAAALAAGAWWHDPLLAAAETAAAAAEARTGWQLPDF